MIAELVRYLLRKIVVFEAFDKRQDLLRNQKNLIQAKAIDSIKLLITIKKPTMWFCEYN